jgi:hypothetical protein
VSSVMKSQGRQLVGPTRCECGNSAEGGGIYPCDDAGRKIDSSDLVYCDRCDKITLRETGQFVRHRSFLVWACGSF